MENQETQFAEILAQLAGITTGYRVIDLTERPVLTASIYSSVEEARAVKLDNYVVVNGDKPWKVWYMAWNGAKLMQEFSVIEQAWEFMAITPVQLRLTGPCALNNAEPSP